MEFKGTLPLWKPKWGPEQLKRKHAEIRDRAFNQGYRMKAYADSDYTFPNFKHALQRGLSERLPEPFPPDWIIVTGVDLSSEKRPGNVIWTGSMSGYGIFRPIDVACIKASSPKVAALIGETVKRFHPHLIVVENNAYQSSLIDWIQAYPERFPFGCDIVPFQTGKNKADPEFGLPGLDVEYLNGRWVIPGDLNPIVNGHDPACECGPCRWIREVSMHPNAAQADTVMAQWFFREGCRMLQRGGSLEDNREIIDPEQAGEFAVFGYDVES